MVETEKFQTCGARNILINLPADFGDYDCLCLNCANPKARILEAERGVMHGWIMRYDLRKSVFNLEDEFKEVCRGCMKCVCPDLGKAEKCGGCNYSDLCLISLHQ